MTIKQFICVVALLSFLTACDNAETPDQELQMIGSDEISGINFDDMNMSVHPGDDFNLYVSGGWIDRTEIPADKSRYGSTAKLRDAADRDVRAIIEEAAASGAAKGSNEQKVGDLYQSYLDMETRNALGVKPLENRLAKIDAISDLKGISEYFAEAGKNGFNSPITLYIGVDAKIPTQYALHTYQTGLGLPDREYYFEENDKMIEIRSKYVEHIEKMMLLAGLDFSAADAIAIMDLETRIAEHHWQKEDNRDGNKRYNKHSNAEFKSLMSNMDIDRYLAITGSPDIADIIVSQPSYLEGLNGLLATVDIDGWKSYLRWSYINDMASRLNAEIDNQNFDFYSKTISGVEQQRPLWQRAVAAVSGNLGEVVGEVYVARHFKPDAKARMVGLVQNLIDAYADSIKELDWMGTETKGKALAKLAKFTPKIGYPDKWKDYSALEISADDLAGNIERSALTVHMRELAKLGGPIDKTEWGMFPQTVNAYYNPTMNEIVFPAAILQPPFFNMSADDAVNYGGIGGVIGHEVGHGFDDSGSRYNGDGALENWWTDDDKEKFKERTDVLIAQYDAYEPVAGTHVNGTFTLGENIGDLSGMSIAYNAYKKSLGGRQAPVIDGLTGDQRFFIGWAQAFQEKIRDEAVIQQIKTDPHSPSRYRINGIVFNIDAFYDAFDVGPEHKLYSAPEERVRIW